MPRTSSDTSAFYGKGYDTVEDAASGALQFLGWQPNVHNQEYMALIIRNPDDGKYYRTDAQTQHDRMHSEWRGYPGGKVAAIVHSHPAQQVGDKYPHTDFSLGDVDTAKTMGVPNYIAAQQADGTPAQDRQFTPGVTKLNAMGAHGDQFLSEIPIDELVQHINQRSPIANWVRQQQMTANAIRGQP